MASYTFMILLSIFMILYAVSIYLVIKNDTPYKWYIICLLVSAFFPFVADGCVTMTRHYEVADIGYTILYLGMDMMLFFLLRFVMFYCDIQYRRKLYTMVFRLLCTLDCISIALNGKFHHVYSVVTIGRYLYSDPYVKDELSGRVFYGVEGGPYYYVHGVLCIIAVLIGIGFLVWKITQTAAIYWIKYISISVSLLVTVIWYISVMISNSPIDASVIGYAITGLLIVFFTVIYRPATLINNLLSASLRSSESGIVLFDNKKNVVFINHSFAEMFKLEDSDYKKAGEIYDNLTKDEDIPGGTYTFVKRVTDEEKGMDIIYEIDISEVYDRRHEYCGFYAKIKDRTDEETEMERERFLATHDSLTGLYNQEALYRLTDEKLAGRNGKEYMAVVSNISGFKVINDVFGTDRADDVLKNIARELTEITGPGCIVGRITADRFGVFIKKDKFDPSRFSALCKSMSMDKGDYRYPIIMHIGVCPVDSSDMTSQMVFDRAFLAIEGIKNDLQKVLAYYDDSAKEAIVWEQMITASIDEAIRDGDIIPFIQAQVKSDGTVGGGEALIRWNHKTEGMLPPGKFISVLEKNGLIVKADRCIWESACRILGKWNEKGYKDMYLSVNISPRDFYFTNVYDDITGYVGKYGISPDQLRLEITETAMLNNMDAVLDVIAHLRNDGYIVEMDDFGSGYSSLNTLKTLPVDVLKVDMLFLRNIKDADTVLKSSIILSNVINMALEMGLSVITEGVETEEQKQFLEECGCHQFQGYFFSKPIPVSEFEDKFIKKDEVKA